MELVRALTPVEKKQVASLRSLIASADSGDVTQGVMLLLALAGTDLFEIFATGVAVNEKGNVQHGPEIGKRARAAFRDWVALSVLGATRGATSVKCLTDVVLAAPVDLSPFTALQTCSITGRHREELVLRGLPHLQTAAIKTFGDVLLEDLPALRGITVRRDRYYTYEPDIRVRVTDTPKLARLTLVDVEHLQCQTIASLVDATVWDCSAEVHRALASQPSLTTLKFVNNKYAHDYRDADIGALSGAPALRKLVGNWRKATSCHLPSLQQIEFDNYNGETPIPDGLPALETLKLRRAVSNLTLRDLPSLRTVTLYDEDMSNFVSDYTQKLHLENVGVFESIELETRDASVVLRNIPTLTKVRTAGAVVVEHLDALTDLAFGQADCFPRFLGLPSLLAVTSEGTLTDISAVAAHTGLRALTLRRRPSATPSSVVEFPPPLDLAPLAALTALESLTLDGLDRAPLAPIKAARRLQRLAVGAHPDLVETALALPDLSHLSVGTRLTLQELRALVDHPSLTSIQAEWDAPPWLCAHCRADSAESIAHLRTHLDICIAGLARTPTPPARKDRAALASARHALDSNEARALLPLFAESGPDLARTLCEGTYIDSSGQLVIGKVLANMTRVGVRGSAALIVADAAGLLTGVTILSLRGITVRDLAVLRRHAGTLNILDITDTGTAVAEGVLHGDALLRVLDAATPLPGDSTEPLIAPIEIDRLPPLLGASSEDDVMAGVALAIASGRVAEALEGCALLDSGKGVRPGTLLGKSGASKGAVLRAVLALLEALPAGVASGREVTTEITTLEVLDGQVPGWARHAASVHELRVALTDLTAVLAVLPAPEEITRLVLRASTGDLTPVQALLRLTHLNLTADAEHESSPRDDLRGLEGHPTIQEVTLALTVAHPEALARMPALKCVVLTQGSVPIDTLVRALGDRRLRLSLDPGSRLPVLAVG